MAGSYRKNAGYRNPKNDVIRKAVCNKTKSKTKNEMAGRRVQRSEKDGVNEWRDRSRNRETWRHIVKEAKAHPGL
jgi:hypothetical protein